MQWSLFPALFMMTFRSFLSAVEHARIVLIATILAAVANAMLNYAFIFGNWGAPALGLPGAAIASLGSTSLAFACLAAYCVLVPAIARFEIYVRIWRADWPAFFEVLQLGWPVSLTVIAEVGLFAASSILMGWIGTIELAAHGIALQLASIVFMIPLGISNAATIRVGNARGRGDTGNMRRAAIMALLLSGGVAIAGAAAFLLIPEPLVWLFLEADDPGSATVAAIAVPLLAVAASFQLFDGLQAVGAGSLRGIKDMRMSMALAIFSYWCIGMTSAYLLAFGADLGGVGVWLGLAVGLAFAAVSLNFRFYRLTAKAG